MLLAAIDYGTVTSRLLVAEVCAGRVEPVLKKTVITHLGEELAASGRISTTAQARAVEATAGFMADIDRLASDLNRYLGSNEPSHSANLASMDSLPLRAVATSAMRDAENSGQVLAALAELGVYVEVIAGLREAALGFAGTLSGFAPSEVGGRTVLVVDIGGGSTELVVGQVSEIGQPPDIRLAKSIDIGARRVTDRWLTNDPPSTDQLAAARSWIGQQLQPWLAAMSSQDLQVDLVIGVAGTATGLVAIRDRLAVYDPALVHGQVVSRGQLAAITTRLAAMTLAERQQVVGLEPARAPVMVGGLLILGEVFRLLGLSEITVSESDILQGVILDAWRQLTVEIG